MVAIGKVVVTSREHVIALEAHSRQSEQTKLNKTKRAS
jgi:hypothetical protein